MFSISNVHTVNLGETISTVFRVPFVALIKKSSTSTLCACDGILLSFVFRGNKLIFMMPVGVKIKGRMRNCCWRSIGSPSLPLLEIMLQPVECSGSAGIGVSYHVDPPFPVSLPSHFHASHIPEPDPTAGSFAKRAIIRLPVPKPNPTSKTVLFNLCSTSRLSDPGNRSENFPTWK